MQRPRGGGALDPLWETAGSPGREVGGGAGTKMDRSQS